MKYHVVYIYKKTPFEIVGQLADNTLRQRPFWKYSFLEFLNEVSKWKKKISLNDLSTTCIYH